MTNYREILRLNSLGINNTQVAASCGCTRPTVIQILQRAKASGLSYHQSTQFNKYYGDYVQKIKATKHIEHKPGDVMETDWAGTTAQIVDTDTGELIPAYLFVATLPYSGYSYVEAFFSEKQDCWITGHVNAYRYFGGTTRIVRPDNLKTGIVKNTREETVVNKTYQEMAEYYGTCVLPARVYRPKDKATVEGTVKIVTTFIVAALRNERFYSLSKLNAALKEKLEVFNHKPFQKKDGSRYSVFQQEKHFLMPLPKHHFELSEWRVAIVQSNYHIACLKQNYSIPFEYIGRQVDVRITKNIIEVFLSGSRICSHPRLNGPNNQYHTVEEHMPPNHRYGFSRGPQYYGGEN